MSVDKLVDSAQLDADLTSVANAIRTKGGTSAQLAFPADFVSAVDAIETGGGAVKKYAIRDGVVLDGFTISLVDGMLMSQQDGYIKFYSPSTDYYAADILGIESISANSFAVIEFALVNGYYGKTWGSANVDRNGVALGEGTPPAHFGIGTIETKALYRTNGQRLGVILDERYYLMQKFTSAANYLRLSLNGTSTGSTFLNVKNIYFQEV